MARRPRRIIGWIEVESSQDRLFRHAVLGEGKAGDGMQVKLRRIPGTDDYEPTYWCGADRPATDRTTFMVRPVYNNTKLHAGAECEHCGIELADLQRDVNEVLDAVYG
jgi:hypothetical protein